MKKLSLLIIAMISIIAFQNCKKDTKENNEEGKLTDLEAKVVVDSGISTDNLLDMVDLYAFESSANKVQQLPSCITETITRNGSSVTIVWEFDENGCTMPNGNTYKGKITITRDWDLTASQVNGSITFSDFYVNNFKIEGSTDFVRELNANGNPQVTHHYNFTFTFPNGSTAVRSGERNREWAEGFGTPSRTDDVFLVTGNAHIKRVNGSILDATIITPLRREATCRYFVSGTINITKNNHTAVLDFGNGTCDAEATLTLPDGTVRTINL